MPNPTQSAVHVNRPLTNISVAYMQEAMHFAYRSMFPAVPVDKKSDSYFLFDLGDSKRDELKPRAPGTESAGSGFRLSTDTYNCARWDLHDDIADDIRDNADEPIDMDQAVTATLTERAMIRQERIFAANYLTAGKWAKDYSGVASGAVPGTSFVHWNDYTTSDPAGDVQRAMSDIHKNTGYRPNRICMAQDVADALVEHPDVIDRVNSGQTSGLAQVDYTDLAKYFRVKDVVISGAVYNKAKEGEAINMDYIAAGVMLLAYVAPAPALMTPSAGYRFNWRKFAGNTEGLRVKKFRMEHLESDRVEIGLSVDMKLVGASLGALFSSVLA